MLRLRILSAVIVTVLTVGALYLDRVGGSGWGLATAMALFAVLGLREFYRMARSHGWEPFAAFGMIMGPLLVFGHERWCLEKWHGAERFSPDLFSTLIAVTVLGTFLLPVIRRRPRGATAGIGSTLMGLIYVWFLPSFLARLRHLGVPGGRGWASDGVEFVLVCIFVAKCSDVGGFLVGSKLGRHKLCPSLSPKKTWEGLAGGVAFSLATVSLVAWRTDGALASMGWARILGLGVLLACAALLGDLVESVFKRDSEVKDAGRGVPGFGGVLDLVDSLMIGAPAMYFYLLLVADARPGLT